MNIYELEHFIKENIPTFIDVQILSADGLAYHYTTHAEEIKQCKRFYGAPINKELDKTQTSLNSPPATSDPGVVFAYEKIEDAKEEGFGCDIIEIEYSCAIQATHSQESECGAPPQILILNSDIKDFRILT